MPLTISRKRHFYRYGIIALAALFFLLCLPLLPSVSRWRGDERFYTDAVIGMTQSGNYLTPTYSDGTLRFKKPILSYWVILLSYKTMGINYLASRLPFLLAGTLVVGLTYRFALVLIRRRPEALVAAAVMASNLTVLHTAIRSTPDMLLTLCILISMIGFANLLFQERRSVWDYSLAYLGVALAVATKGLFGLLPILFVVGYVQLAKPPSVRWRDLVHGPVLIATLPVALFWFIMAFIHHGDTAVSAFWGDQIGERFSGSKWYILSNAGVYLASFVLELLPWSAFVLVPLYYAWRKKISLFPNHRSEGLFIVSWILLLYGIFIFGNIQRTRYFLPAYPHFAILFALLLCAGFRHPAIRSHLKKIFLSLCGVVFTAGIVLIIAGCKIHCRWLASGIILSALSLFLITRFSRWAPTFVITGFGVLLITVFSVWYIGIRSVFCISPAPEITKKVLAFYPAGTSIAMVGVSLNYVSQIRVLSGGLVRPTDLPESSSQADIEKYPLLVCTKPDFEQRKFKNGTVVAQSCGLSGWHLNDFIALLISEPNNAVWESQRQEYYLVRP